MSHDFDPHADYPPKPTKQQHRHVRSGYRYISLERLATVLKLAVLLTCMAMVSASVVNSIGVWNFPNTFNDMDAPLTNAFEQQLALALFLAAMIMLLAFLTSIVLVCTFMYRANANLRRMGVSGLEFTPGWCGGWWFIPFANLVKPYQAMIELQRFSERPDGGSWSTFAGIHWWWGFWLVSGFVSRLSTRLEEHVSTEMVIGIDLAGSLLLLFSGVLLCMIVSRITIGQSQHHLKLSRQHH